MTPTISRQRPTSGGGRARTPRFSLGDRVQLKCGGPMMTVRDQENGLVRCAWPGQTPSRLLMVPSHFLHVVDEKQPQALRD
jgi:hypothetical protein